MLNAPIIQPGDKVFVVFPDKVMLENDGETLTEVLEQTYPGVEFEVGSGPVVAPILSWIYRDPDGYITWHKEKRENAASEVVGVTPVNTGYKAPVGYTIPPRNFDGGQAL
jgi:hypothetical protein